MYVQCKMLVLSRPGPTNVFSTIIVGLDVPVPFLLIFSPPPLEKESLGTLAAVQQDEMSKMDLMDQVHRLLL